MDKRDRDWEKRRMYWYLCELNKVGYLDFCKSNGKKKKGVKSK